jgi:hypothetical protein
MMWRFNILAQSKHRVKDTAQSGGSNDVEYTEHYGVESNAKHYGVEFV